ncbi:pentatricopeptide repeat-containing protein CRR2, chloroplastic-like [Humulus lupulus]|uniref:pentatricopeptide repeat-containing protein CRR2, chloroplastic-like n=1 Tax=Humulus lupulus TaxID=3486 RepID=UPI002B412112|nr:pentatricopeptide repeat-containing protein CRR2, chloroplastic-like [Humulus lupulus]
MQTQLGAFQVSRRRDSLRLLQFYLLISLRDSHYFTFSLEHCKNTKSIKIMHAHIIVCGHNQNPFTASKLAGKYIEHSSNDSIMDDARKVFDSLLKRDVFLWNVVIQGYAKKGPFVEAIDMYCRMRRSGILPNNYTYPYVLKACGAMKDWKNGQVVHGHAVLSGLHSDLFVGNALVAFYSKCQEVEVSRKVFDGIAQKDIISWNSLISGYAANGYVDEALMAFCTLLRDRTTCSLNHSTLVSTLPACVQASAIQVGLWIHSYIIKTGMEVDVTLSSGLISMYANCGQVSIAREVFVQTRDKSLEVWSAMIRCYGMHGHADEAVQMFSQFLDFGLYPDGVMFLCLLCACSHAGMVEKGCQIFEKMEEYGVVKSQKHYACMVDLFGRAGFIDQAIEFIRNMPLQPGKDVYGALLGACRMQNDTKLAEELAKRLLVVDPDNAQQYITMASLYEEKGRWEEAARLREELREKNIRKLTGTSLIHRI